MRCGIVGLPNSGKSTFFNALSSSGHALVAGYPFTTIEPNVGVVSVPDSTLEKLSKIATGSKKTTPANIEFVDIAGLVKGASAGEGLGNKFLGEIREVDGIIHIVRNFKDKDVSHVYGDINPSRDIEIINAEISLADLETAEKRLDSLNKLKKTGEEKYFKEIDFLNKIKDKLNKSENLYFDSLSDDEAMLFKSLHLLSAKPVLYVLNIGENELKKKEQLPEIENSIAICAKLEAELLEFSAEERFEFLKDFNITETGLSKIIQSAYRMLNLITFYTFNENELRAWELPAGSSALAAAGKIHSDMEKGFIKADVISADVLLNTGSISKAKEKGLIRIEGKDYIVQNKDILYFKFSS